MASTFSWVGNNIVVRYTKDVTLRDVEHVNNLIFADPRFDDMRFQFNIFEEDATFAMTDLEFKKILHVEKASANSNKRPMYHALVLRTQDQGLFDACILYQSFIRNHGWEAEIFGKMEDAQRWIEQHVSLTNHDIKLLQELTQ